MGGKIRNKLFIITIGVSILAGCGTVNSGVAEEVRTDMSIEKNLNAQKPNLSESSGVGKNTQKVNGSEVKQAQVFQSNLQVRKTNSELELDFTMENISGKAQTLTFSSGQEYDYYVYNKNNELIYQWSDGRMFTMIIKDVTLNSGDRLHYKDVWNFVDKSGNKVPDGEYRIEFKVTASVQASDGSMVNVNELKAGATINTIEE